MTEPTTAAAAAAAAAKPQSEIPVTESDSDLVNIGGSASFDLSPTLTDAEAERIGKEWAKSNGKEPYNGKYWHLQCTSYASPGDLPLKVFVSLECGADGHATPSLAYAALGRALVASGTVHVGEHHGPDANDSFNMILKQDLASCAARTKWALENDKTPLLADLVAIAKDHVLDAGRAGEQMKAYEIRGLNDLLLAVYIDRKVLAATDGAQFHTTPEAQLQLATMSRPKGYVVKAHKHEGGARTVWQTQEVLVVVRGRLQITIYDRDGTFHSVVHVGDGEAILLVDGGHAVTVVEESVFFEIKQGPFLGKDDKVQIGVYEQTR